MFLDFFHFMKLKIASAGLKESTESLSMHAGLRRFSFNLGRTTCISQRFSIKWFSFLIKPREANMELCELAVTHWQLFMCLCRLCTDSVTALNQSIHFFPYKSMTLEMMIQTARLHTVMCLFSTVTGGHNSETTSPFSNPPLFNLLYQ